MHPSTTRPAERLLQAGQAIARNDFGAAEALCRAELAADPQSAEAVSLLGVIAARRRRPAEAAQLFAEAVRRAPEAGRYGVNLARALTELGRWDEAGRAVAAALDQADMDAGVLNGAADVLVKLGRHDEALAATERAAALAPSSLELAYRLAATRHYRGDIAGAEQGYIRMLEIAPSDHRAWWSLVQLRRQTPQDGRIEPMRRLFEAAGGEVEPSLYLGHALAKSFEDFGELEESLDWLVRAKAVRRARIPRTADSDPALFAAAARARPSGPGFEGEAPIFVVGLPRSGTTLVDRILSSHSKVVSAGERTDMFVQLKLMGGSRTPWLIDPDAFERAGGIAASGLGQAYAAAARPPGARGRRFIDKAPLNVLYAGVINAALPNARIICLRRHPMDSCLSIFRQLFALDQPFYDYAYDFRDLARHYALFERLAGHWRETLPADRFTEVAYETLVADQEAESRRLVEFCGLDWEDACLAFHENAAPVATASAVQVRQPLYATSVGRWRGYGAALEPLAQALRAEGVAFD